MSTSIEFIEKIKNMAVEHDNMYPGAIVVAEQFGWLRIALLLNVTEGGIQMTSRGKIVNDGGWFYSLEEMPGKKIYVMPITTEISDLKEIWPEEEWQQDIQEQWDSFFAKPENKAIRDKYLAAVKS